MTHVGGHKRRTFKELQALIASVKVSVHNSAKLASVGSLWFQCAKGKTTANQIEQQGLPKTDPEDFRKNILWIELNFLDGLSLITSDIRLTQHFNLGYAAGQ